MKKFSKKLMAIKKRRPSTGRNVAKSDFIQRDPNNRISMDSSEA